MFTIEHTTANNIDSSEKFYDSLSAPTTTHIRPNGSLNDAPWMDIFNHKMATTTYQVVAIRVNLVLRHRGSQCDLNELVKLIVECNHYVRTKVYQALFRLLRTTLKNKCHFTMPRRVVLRAPTFVRYDTECD